MAFSASTVPSKNERRSLTPCANNVILRLLTDDVLGPVLDCLGPLGTVQCAMTCTRWKQSVYQNHSLWRSFCSRTFGLDEEGNRKADWRKIYAYLSFKAIEPPRLIPNVQVLFADDGGVVLERYQAKNVVQNSHQAWCTNADVEENVDLVIQTQIPALVSGFAMRNGGYRFSAPLRQALVFASYDAIDLEAARSFDTTANGPSWMERLGSPPTNSNELSPVQNIQHSIFRELVVTGLTMQLDPIPPQHVGVTRTTKQPQDRGGSILQPLAAFWTPNLPGAYASRLERRCPPTVVRQVHFKLLNSHNEPNRPCNNIDVMDLWTYGVPLPELEHLLGSMEKLQVFSYARRHALRQFPYGAPEMA